MFLYPFAYTLTDSNFIAILLLNIPEYVKMSRHFHDYKKQFLFYLMIRKSISFNKNWNCWKLQKCIYFKTILNWFQEKQTSNQKYLFIHFCLFIFCLESRLALNSKICIYFPTTCKIMFIFNLASIESRVVFQLIYSWLAFLRRFLLAIRFWNKEKKYVSLLLVCNFSIDN